MIATHKIIFDDSAPFGCHGRAKGQMILGNQVLVEIDSGIDTRNECISVEIGVVSDRRITECSE